MLLLLVHLALVKRKQIHRGVQGWVQWYVHGDVPMFLRFAVILMKTLQRVETQLQVSKLKEIGKILVWTSHHRGPSGRCSLVHYRLLRMSNSIRHRRRTSVDSEYFEYKVLLGCHRLHLPKTGCECWGRVWQVAPQRSGSLLLPRGIVNVLGDALSP